MIIDSDYIAKNSHLKYQNQIIVNVYNKIYNINNKAIIEVYVLSTYTFFFCFNYWRILVHRLIIYIEYYFTIIIYM